MDLDLDSGDDGTSRADPCNEAEVETDSLLQLASDLGDAGETEHSKLNAKVLRARMPAPRPPLASPYEGCTLLAVLPGEMLRQMERKTPKFDVRNQQKSKLKSFKRVRKQLARHLKLKAQKNAQKAKEAKQASDREAKIAAANAKAEAKAASKVAAAKAKAGEKDAAKAAAKSAAMAKATSKAKAKGKASLAVPAVATADATAVTATADATAVATVATAVARAAATSEPEPASEGTIDDILSMIAASDSSAGSTVLAEGIQGIRRPAPSSGLAAGAEQPLPLICVPDALLLLTELAEASKIELATLPAECSPQVASTGKSNYTIKFADGATVCEIQLANRCFRLKRFGSDWKHPCRTFSWSTPSGQSPADAWAEFKSKTGLTS